MGSTAREVEIEVGVEFVASQQEAISPIVQELLGHTDVKTTMIYTHVLNRGGRGVYSPADRLTCSVCHAPES